MQLKAGAHIHLMGICGTAMASLAGILKDLGYRVTGSDQNVYPPMSTQLQQLGIEIMQGYKSGNLSVAGTPDLVVVGNVITRNHEEAQALLKSDIPYTSLPKAMGDFVIQNRNSVVLAGTHGKTTMTSMMAWVADVCQKQAGFLVGGIPLNFQHSFLAPKGNWFIIEGDEYDTAFFDKVPKFIHYKPKYVVISSLEFDHADIYNSLDEIKDAFYQLVKRIPEDGILVYNADVPPLVELAQKAKCKIVGYGHQHGDYQICERMMLVGRNHFAVQYRGEKIADIALKQFGLHNSLNSLAVYALAKEMGWNERQVLQALASFKGVKRRQELLGEPRGVKIFEDFAHHPTAVKMTLECMKEAYPNNKLFAVFEPRSATSRRAIFQKEYAQAFGAADDIIIAPPFDQSKISEVDRFSSDTLVEDLNKNGRHAQTFSDTDAIAEYINSTSKDGDVVIVMSNGGFNNIYPKLLQS